jgi:hypothetical protein
VLAPPCSVDLKGSRAGVPIGGYPVDLADEDASNPVRSLLLQFEAEAADKLWACASYLLRIWDGEAAARATLATVHGAGVFILRIPPAPDHILELVYVRDGPRVVVLGGYLSQAPPGEIEAAIAEAISRRP